MDVADGHDESGPNKLRVKSVPWTAAEVDALHRAVEKHGHHQRKWMAIKQDPDFATLLWRPIKGLQSKWHMLEHPSKVAGASPGGPKRKDRPSQEDGKSKKVSKRTTPSELLARAFDGAPTLSELSVHSEAEEEEVKSVVLAEKSVENEGGLAGLQDGPLNGVTEGAALGAGPVVEGPEKQEKAEEEQQVENHMDDKQGELGQKEERERVDRDESAAVGGPEATPEGAVPMETDDTRSAAEGMEGLETSGDRANNGSRVTEEGGHREGGEQPSESGGPGLQLFEASLGAVAQLPRIDLNEAQRAEEDTGALERGFAAMEEAEHFEDRPHEPRGGEGLRQSFSEIQPDGGLEEALGFFPDEGVPEEDENVVLAQKRAEIQEVERKLRVLERRKEAWMRAFEKKRAQYEARMADVENLCRRREKAQEAQRQVVYQEKWALEAARQAAVQLLQDLLALVPPPDGVSLSTLHPSLSWESTFGPSCMLRRQIIEQQFDKRQKAVGTVKAAALDAHRKKKTMAKKLGLDVRDEDLTEEVLQSTPEFRAFNEKLDELKQQMEVDLKQLEERENAAQAAWTAFQEKGETVHQAETQLKALLKEGQMKKPREKQGRKTM